MSPTPNYLSDRFRGILIGTAVGDALGLPAEGMSRRRIGKLHGGPWRHRFLPGRGMVSDDTEQSLFVARSLIGHPDSPRLFASSLARSLRWWLLSLPAAVGFGTLRSIMKLWIGFPPGRSGAGSAGNGAAMRSALIGGYFAGQPARIDEFVEASTRITHSDRRALVGARAVAHVAAAGLLGDPAVRPEPEDFRRLLREAGEDDDEWCGIVDTLSDSWEKGLSVGEFARRLGLTRGITVYVYHTVPVVAYAWFGHFGNFEETVVSVLDCGGDTDTTGAIAGALAGAVVGEKGIPPRWVAGVKDWPVGVPLLRKTSDKLAERIGAAAGTSPPAWFWPAVPLRNLLFLSILLIHGFRRLCPPY